MAQATVTSITRRPFVHPAPMQVERGIPIPKIGRRKTYPWEEMRVGDSFFVECPQDGLRKAWSAVSTAAKSWERNHGGHFTVRRVEGGLRVWRVRADSE